MSSCTVTLSLVALGASASAQSSYSGYDFGRFGPSIVAAYFEPASDANSRLSAQISVPAPSGEPAAAAEATRLAKLTQNPVADLISVPFQYNANFEVGPFNRTQSVLNIQPVIPITLSDSWNLITRTILPVLVQPDPSTDDSTSGVGDLNTSLFFSPRKPGGLVWGIGPIFSFPTASNDILGSGKYGIGPAGVVLTMEGPWVYGVLANNVFSYAGDSNRAAVSQMLVQPFVNYNLSDGWAITSGPMITSNWKAPSDDRWTVPVGAGFAKVLKLGKLPMKLSLAGYSNVVHPDAGPTWSVQFQLTFLFPK